MYRDWQLTTLDFLFDSTVKCKLDLLDRLRERALRLIGRGQMNNRAIENAYGIEPLREYTTWP